MLQTTKIILTERTGAVAILLMCIMGSFILITGVLVAASISASGKSYSDATLQISGKSILSEYDRKMLDEYGLLCFRGDEIDIKNKLIYYANGSFDSNQSKYSNLTSNRKSADLLKLKMEDLEVTLKEYSMVDVDHYEKQIKEALKMTIFKDVTRKKNDKKNNRILKNEIIIESLPSAGFKGSIFPDLTDAANIPDWSEIKGSVTGRFAKIEYAMKMFKYANNGDLGKQTFFNNEIEYILEGKLSDDVNYSSVKTKLVAIRYALNALYLISDKTKMAAITAQASLTGPATPAAEAAIFATWVGAETDNDLDLLEQGDNAALTKTSSNWALTDLTKVIDGISSSEEAVYPVNKKGQNYEDYLRLLLYLEDRETMLLRMMDLTQINMKGTYYGDFLMKEHYAGYRFSTVIKGDTFNYVQQY